MGAGVASELEYLRKTLLRAGRLSRTAERRIEEVLERTGIPGARETWFTPRTAMLAAPDQRHLLETLRRDHTEAFAELRTIAVEHTGTPAPSAADAQVTADHVDFRDATFHDRVVGVQHNQHHHYGTVPAPAEWRPVGQVEPLEFGVRPTRHVPGLPDVPPYVPRDRDEDLRASLAHRGLVLILGEPYAGKSYTAWQGVRSLEGHRLYAPDLGEDLRAVLSALHGKPGRYVVWLDELTDHLDAGGLDPRLLGRLTSLGAVVFGTMSPDEYYRRRAGTTSADRVVASARTVELAREWSEAELQRLAAHDDPRAYPAYMWSGREGAASYFAIGHLLFDEWRREGTRLKHPRGQLLVRAAVDLARCGVTGAVPVDLLRTVQEQYTTTEEHESFEDALAWATKPMFGVSGLLVQGEEVDTWRAYGALVAEALRSGADLEPVPDGVWWTLLDAAEGGAPIDRGAVLDAARVALQARLDAEDADVLYAFADRVGGDEHKELLRRAADAGHPQAAEGWAAHLLHAGDETGALRYMEAAAESGSSSAACEAGRLHLGRAEKWLTRASDAEAAHLLGDLLLLRGRFTEAHEAYLSAEQAGYAAVARSSGVYHLLMNGPRTAKVWLTRAAKAGDVSAQDLLSTLESAVDDTEAYFAPSPVYPLDFAHYGVLVEEQGREDEARELYEEGYSTGDAYAAYRLGALLDKQGQPVEARDWYAKAADVGHHAAEEALGDTPEPPDNVKE